MTSASERVLFWVLSLYLAGFAFLSPNYSYVRREHSLIWWGIRERSSDLRRTGTTSLHAWGEFLGELNPLALTSKTISDSSRAPMDFTQLRWYPLRLGIVASTLFAVVLLAFDILPEEPPPSGISSPSSDPAGQIENLGDVDTLREGIYRSTGVCLDPEVTGWDLTDELLRDGSPGADCSELDDPREREPA